MLAYLQLVLSTAGLVWVMGGVTCRCLYIVICESSFPSSGLVFLVFGEILVSLLLSRGCHRSAFAASSSGCDRAPPILSGVPNGLVLVLNALSSFPLIA